jgi:DNA helicase-2/ATP-dependent DNA helicase PcrA
MAREDEFGQLFADIEQLCSAYMSGKFGEFLDVYAGSGTRIERHSQKFEVSKTIDNLNRLRQNSSIGEVLDYVFQQNLLQKPKKISALEKSIENPVDAVKAAKDSVFLDELRDTEYSQVIEFEKYLNNETPFSTNHGVKGEQYDNVLVVIDDKLWNQYKFESVLAGDEAKSQHQRSLNLFYVACSRPTQRLAVLAQSDISAAALAGAEHLFGGASVHSTIDIPSGNISDEGSQLSSAE